jgi:hypothetical protein
MWRGERARAAAARQAVAPPNREVTRVLAVFKCHLDVGFTNTQAAVVRRYFDDHFPRAVRIARESRQAGRHRYVWTTGSWLLYEYLERPAPEDRRRMEQAIVDGALPGMRCRSPGRASWSTHR